MLDAGLDATLEQIACCAGIVAVVLQRISHRFRDDGVGSEVDDGLDLMVTQQLRYEFA